MYGELLISARTASQQSVERQQPPPPHGAVPVSLIASSHHRRRRRRRHPVSARPRSRCARPVADTDDYLQQPDCDRLAAASRVLDVVVVVVGERPRARRQSPREEVSPSER